jgi:hypothetical protein
MARNKTWVLAINRVRSGISRDVDNRDPTMAGIPRRQMRPGSQNSIMFEHGVSRIKRPNAALRAAVPRQIGKGSIK